MKGELFSRVFAMLYLQGWRTKGTLQFAIEHDANLTEVCLPETVEVALKDGSEFLAGVEWDTT